MRKIYVLFIKFPDKGSKAIEWMTGSKYPHATIGLEEDMNKFYSFVFKGFIIEEVSRYVRGNHAYPCQLYEIKVSEKTYNKVKKTINYFIENQNKFQYARIRVILSMFHIPSIKNRYSYFCSEFVADVLHKCGVVELNKKSSHYFTKHIQELPGVRLNYEGNLKKMMEYFRMNNQYV